MCLQVARRAYRKFPLSWRLEEMKEAYLRLRSRSSNRIFHLGGYKEAFYGTHSTTGVIVATIQAPFIDLVMPYECYESHNFLCPSLLKR